MDFLKKVTSLRWWEFQWRKAWNLKWWKERRFFSEGLLIVLPALAIAVFAVYLSFEYEEAARNLILLTAGVVGWCFLYWRTKIAEQGVTVERLTRAMEQLASENSSIRWAGFLGLEQVAVSQEEERIKIIEILSARIRELAPIDSKTEPSEQSKRLDIEAVVNTLARIAESLYDEKEIFCNLRKAKLCNLRLFGTDLSFFNLEGTDFTNTELFGVDFTETNLVEVNFSGTRFEDVFGLTQEQINTAFCWKGNPPIDLPEGLKPPPEREQPKTSNGAGFGLVDDKE